MNLYPSGPVLSEINLLRYPFSLLSNNNLQELLEESARQRESHIFYKATLPNGKTRIWRVSPNTKYGYTTSFDKTILVTVLKLVTDDGFPPSVLYKLGSLSKICRTMQLADSGRNRSRIKDSLVRISATNIYTETFYLKATQRYWREHNREIGGSFSLWSIYWKGDQLPNGDPADCVYLQFNIPFILSLHDFYVKPLDYNYWLNLSPLAQRLYELTGLKFYGLKDSSYINFSYPELCQVMPIKLQRHFSVARRILERAHQQLCKTQWLEKVEWDSHGQRTFDPESPWTIRYYPGPRAQEELSQAKERLRRYQKVTQRDQLPLWRDVQAWVHELSEMLQDSHGQNTGFYTKIGKLITQGKLNVDLVWEAMHMAKTEDLEGRVSKSRSAFFTDYLKRQLKKREQDLKDLLEEV